MAAKPLPDPDVLRQLLRYEPETGKLFWRARGPEWFTDWRRPAEHSCTIWNTHYVGSEAFTTLHVKGYRIGRIFRSKFFAHRVIWHIVHGLPDGFEIDHINHDRSDNRLCNLRLATRSQNSSNKKAKEGRASSFLGVTKTPGKRKWRATIHQNRRQIFCGYHETELEAAAAYDEAAKRIHGEFANLNLPGDSP